MDNILLEKLDKIVDDFNSSEEVLSINNYKNKVLNNKEIIDDVSKLNILDNNSDEYKSIKEKLFRNEDYKNYKHLENELYYFSLEVGSKLSMLSR